MTEGTGSEASGNPAPAGGEGTIPANNGNQQASSGGDWWGSKIEDVELKGWVENKGFHKKDIGEMAKSYRNLEKLMGADKAGRTVEIPTNMDDATARDSFFNRLGRPESADKYELVLPQGSDKDFEGWARGTFHKLGLTSAQAKALSEEWNGYIGKAAETHTEAYQAAVAADGAALKKEWGAAFDNRIKLAKNAAREFGLDAPTIDKLEEAMGFGKLMKFFAGIGEKIGEDKFVAGDSSSSSFGVMTPGQAMAKITDMNNDKEFMGRYLSGDKAAVERMESLHKMAYPSKVA